MQNTARTDVTIVQPYVPAYRSALFDQLASLFDDAGYRLQIAHATPRGAQAARADSTISAWSRPLRDRTMTIKGHELHFRDTRRLLGGSAAVVAELASTNLDTYLLAAQSRVPLILWGHGKAYVTEPNKVDEALELWLARRAKHLLIYTDSGAAYLEQKGIISNKITVLQNSTDSVKLRQVQAQLRENDPVKFLRDVGLAEAPTACYIGALDDSKQLATLLDAFPYIKTAIPNFQLIVAGSGPLRGRIDALARSRTDVAYIEYADARILALLGRTCIICAIPGRVGLVAVDAMVLGLPIVTTTWAYHGPEREYLADAYCITTANSPREYAQAIIDLALDRERLADARTLAMADSAQFSIENMAQRMAEAVLDSASLRRS